MQLQENRRKLEESCVNPFEVDEDDVDKLTHRLFRIVDSDDNNRISYNELLAYVKAT